MALHSGAVRMPQFPEDLRGRRFGRLIVLSMDPQRTPAGRYKWFVRCDCGNEKSVQALGLKNGDTTSCGCVHSEQLAARNLTHGKRHSPEYQSWAGMLTRCRNPNSSCAKNYSGRGITVCDRWLRFENFLEDMGPKPTKHHTIERIDVNGNYEPSNCKWLLDVEQSRNTRSNIRTKAGTLIADEARRMGVSGTTLYSRVGKLGWDIERAISTPVRRKY